MYTYIGHALAVRYYMSVGQNQAAVECNLAVGHNLTVGQNQAEGHNLAVRHILAVDNVETLVGASTQITVDIGAVLKRGRGRN